MIRPTLFSQLQKLAACLLVAFAAAVFPGVAAESLKIELPQETAAFKPAPGSEIANARCLVCHSADYVMIQPRLSRAFWQGSIVKMRQKYGADIPDVESEPLLDYLVNSYGAPGGNVAPSAASAPNPGAGATPPASSVPLDGPALANRYGCVNCHGLDKKIVGPAMRDIASKYRGAADGPAKIAHQIRTGGGGNWGPVPMPAFSQIPAGEIDRLVEWALNQK